MADPKILVVDDEPPARRKILSYLRSSGHAAPVLEAADGDEAVRLIRAERPDVVFLDIQMPGRSGFDVIREVGPEAMPAVVFVTAFDQYAIEAFEVQAVDYLLKPFDADRFARALARAVERGRSGGRDRDLLEKLLAEVGARRDRLRRIMVKKGPRYVFVDVRDILYISSCEKYVEIHTADSTSLVRETMNALEERLDPAAFVRIHRTSIVAVGAIKEIQPWSHGDYLVILKTGDKLTLSRRYSDRIFEKKA